MCRYEVTDSHRQVAYECCSQPYAIPETRDPQEEGHVQCALTVALGQIELVFLCGFCGVEFFCLQLLETCFYELSDLFLAVFGFVFLFIKELFYEPE